jgi:hypothetical protein
MTSSIGMPQTTAEHDLRLRVRKQELRQIFPSRFLRGNKRKAFFSVPMLDLLLSRNGSTDVAELLVIYKAVNSVALRESLDETLFVLRNSALQIIGHTGVYIS